MVLRAQQWVNRTYAGVSGYNACTENGYTGWGTMFALTRALQHELGITALSDNFGPTTLARLTAYGPVGPSSSNLNMRTIVEAALYCKGYYGGDIDGAFGASTQGGLTTMLQDMGVPPAPFPSFGVMPKVFKALLTMDAYVLLYGGDAGIRACQQWLNGAYYNRAEFFIGPCDGYFSRSVQTALVLAIQYQLGMSDDVVTGAVGPGTRGGLQSQAYVTQSSSHAAWIRLFQCAVQFNGRDPDWGHAGTFTATLASQVRSFQNFCALPGTGAGDYQTWMSLLVSTGDPNRIGTAFDCMYPLNSTTIQTVKAAGYRIVGRYLTGGTNKVLTNSEIALINDNGLSFFPIYQEFGDSVAYFDHDQGHAAGVAACAAARGLGIPQGTVLYVSVDFDAIDEEITSNVIPHFQGIRDAVAADGGYYAIGVYGCRNTCSRLAAEGLTTRSFVSGMSTGYSGNLGFALPDNWAFDQIANRILAPNTSGSIEIDNDMVSGRDLGVNSVTRPRDPNDGFYTLLHWLEARAQQWRDQGHLDRSGPELVAEYFQNQNPAYGEPGSGQVFGDTDHGFLDFVASYPGMPDTRPCLVDLWRGRGARF
ncbi:glycoside hydrolase domain-containing protein [Dactylosporangium sp. NPDC051485]|uniref:glycoside hydrolase domain-containing protein n=1 Tax=Dactylosporangium sp. NPDC051485 TaxID=3154846 RepID=UPI00341F8F6F